MGGGNLRNKPSKGIGFTLIELLAVIVILAIIALIAVPQVIKILNKARISAALDSSDGYIKAVENKIVLEEMKDKENKITDGTHLVKDLDIDYKGKGPSSGVVVVEKMNIKNARLCINNYSVDYDGEKSSISNSNYCDTDSKLIISVNGNEEEIALTDSLTYNYTLTSDILSSATNISCNNSAVPSIDGNSLKIDNVYGNTLCSVNKTLKESIDNADTSLTNIIMVNDEELSDSISILENKNINLYLNKNNIVNNSGEYAITLYGILNIFGNESSIGGSTNSILILDNGNLIIDGGNYKLITPKGNSNIVIKNAQLSCTNDVKDCYPMFTYDKSNITLDNIIINTLGKAIGISDDSSINIKNSNFNCTADNCVYFESTGDLSIYDSVINSYGYGLRNNSTGNINLYNSSIISQTSYDYVSTSDNTNLNIYSGYYETKGDITSVYLQVNHSSQQINIYGGTFKCLSQGQSLITNSGSDSTINIYDGEFNANVHTIWLSEVSNPGTINVIGGKFNAAYSNIVNAGNGTVNISGGELNAGTYSIDNRKSGIFNVCSGIINGTVNFGDAYNRADGYIYYKDVSIFIHNLIVDNANNPSHIVLNSSLVCSR